MKQIINTIIILSGLFTVFYFSSCNCDDEYIAYPDSLRFYFYTGDTIEFASTNGDTAKFDISQWISLENYTSKRNIFLCKKNTFYEIAVLLYKSENYDLYVTAREANSFSAILNNACSKVEITSGSNYSVYERKDRIEVINIGKVDTFSNVYKVILNEHDNFQDTFGVEECHLYFNFPYGIISFTTPQDSFYISKVQHFELWKKNKN